MSRFLHKDLVNITVSDTLRHLGGALVEVFVPLLLLQKGATLLEVCLFYGVYAAVKLFVNYPVMRLTNARGAKVSLVFSRLSYVGYLSLLSVIVATGDTIYMWPMAAALALTNAFQWNAQHLFISRAISETSKGRDIARMEAVSIFTGSVAPALSAGLSLALGSAWPLMFAIALILLSSLWLRKIDMEAGGHQREKDLVYNLQHAPKRDILANFFYNVHTSIGVMIWPIYLAVTLASATSIGIVTSAAAIVAAFFLLFVGNRNDSEGTAKVLREGSVATFVSHLLRLIPATLATVSFINVVWLLSLRYQQNPWTSAYYSHTRNGGIKYILSMEIACDAAYAATFMTLFLLVSTFGQTGFILMFILAAFASLGCTFITPPQKTLVTPDPA